MGRWRVDTAQFTCSKDCLCRVGAATSSTFLVEKGGWMERVFILSCRRKGKGISNVPLGKEVLAVRACPASWRRQPITVIHNLSCLSAWALCCLAHP